jgi:hypothetical protein
MPRLGYKSAIWAIAHRLCRVVWKILHEGVRFIEQGQEVGPREKKQRAQILARALRKLGYEGTITPIKQLGPSLLFTYQRGFSTERNQDISIVISLQSVCLPASGWIPCFASIHERALNCLIAGLSAATGGLGTQTRNFTFRRLCFDRPTDMFVVHR